MGFAIFGASNPQPIAYTGAHLQKLDRFRNEKRSFLTIFAGSQIMLYGATVRMVVDSIRFTTHAMRDCWRNKKITPLALNSLSKAVRHMVMAVFSVAVQFLSPLGYIKMFAIEEPLLCAIGIACTSRFAPSYIATFADRMGVLPPPSAWTAIGSKVKTVARVADTAFVAFHLYYVFYFVPSLGNSLKAWVIASPEYRIITFTACVLCFLRLGGLDKVRSWSPPASAFAV